MQTIDHELYTQLKSLRAGDLVQYARRTVNGYTTETVRISDALLRPDGVLVFGIGPGPAPHNPQAWFGHGIWFFRLETPERAASPYGIRCLEVIGRNVSDPRTPARAWQPKPGNVAYDLMC